MTAAVNSIWQLAVPTGPEPGGAEGLREYGGRARLTSSIMLLFILMEARGGGGGRAGWSDDTHDCALVPQQPAARVQRAEVAPLVNRWWGEAQLGRGRCGSHCGEQRREQLVGRDEDNGWWGVQMKGK